MGKQFVNTDQNGWTWITRNKKSKPIGNPYHKDLENIATSFYVTNMPPALTSKGLWNMCASHGRLVDAFIANKLSKGGKRFGFIKFLGVKDANSINEAFLDLNSSLLADMEFWIQCSTLLMSCSKFQENESLKRLYSIKRAPMPNFKIDERILWIEVSGLPLCAWGSMAYKKIASSFGKFLFFEKEESTALSSGRLCISTKSHQLISETVQVDIKNESFEVGLISLWDPNMFSKNSILVLFVTMFIIIKGNWIYEVGDCFMVNIYSPQDYVSKLALWNRLTDFMHHHNGSYIMFGDMNAVRNAQERFGTTLNSIEADHFNSFIDSTGLVDLPIGGRSFTWMNKAGTKLSKLDRFLISEDVTIRLPDVRITALDRLWSDHNPILLYIDKTDFGPTLFKLYNSWLLRDGFDNLIKEEWELLDSNLKCHEKFRRLKDKIKQWSNNIKTLERNRKTVTLEEIKEAVWDCGSSKAPGPDGYSFAFVKKYWGTIQKDLYDFVNLFFASCVMPNGANSSFFTLIPKIPLVQYEGLLLAGRRLLIRFRMRLSLCLLVSTIYDFQELRIGLLQAPDRIRL
ncbi:RNA-directed DNA polymerase, eukaryota, reverse transcriptase zinc-binding domain protein [Tanacetum coccineum]